ncbi:MAG: hypothetical protein L3J63_12025, partial [Geopsychrobacter sp.]|nr:hypothetical protein [Geopsychrobacter sp.]
MANLSRKSGKLLLLAGAAALLLASCTESVAPTFKGTPIRIVEAKSISELEAAFYRYRYDIEQLNTGVPPLIIESLPNEITALNSSARKKKLFVQTLLPMVLLANQEIAQERKILLTLNRQLEAGQALTTEQLHQLQTLQTRYAVTGDPSENK